MQGFKTITIAGNITAKPELRQTASEGISVTDITVAVNNPDPNKSTDFFQVVIWKEQAVNTCKYLDKGSPVLVQGIPYFEKYEKDGQTRVAFKVRASTVRFLPDGKQHQNDDTTSDPSAMQEMHEIDENMPF